MSNKISGSPGSKVHSREKSLIDKMTTQSFGPAYLPIYSAEPSFPELACE